MTTQTRGRHRTASARRSFLHWHVLAASAACWVVIIGTPVLVWSVLS